MNVSTADVTLTLKVKVAMLGKTGCVGKLENSADLRYLRFMKTFALLLLILADAAHADDAVMFEYCQIQGERAAQITQARQDGTSYIKTRQRFQDLTGLIDYVYNRPILPTDRLAKLEVQEVRSAVEMVCLRQAGIE